jgi:hypothetical protein
MSAGVRTLTALRLDDVGAASKRHEVYGVTRIAVGRWRIPFPGNFLFLKYVPPIKRWGPYRELKAHEWHAIIGALDAAKSAMTVAITAGWVEDDGRIVPFPVKYPDAAAVIRDGVRLGCLEIANHGYTHCIVAGGRFRARWFSGNRHDHREFHESLPPDRHREHLAAAQDILGSYFGEVVTFVPPGNVFTIATLEAAANVGLKHVSCLDASRFGTVRGIEPVSEEAVVLRHDRDVVCGGLPAFARFVAAPPAPFVTVRTLAEARVVS